MITLSRPIGLVTLGLGIVTLICAAGPASAQAFEWRSDTPDSQGLSKAKLDALKDELATRKTQALLILRNDRIVYEWYAAELDGFCSQGQIKGLAISTARRTNSSAPALYWLGCFSTALVTIHRLDCTR